MRIYVTGATGFVGSNFVHVFADRHRAWSAYVEATRHVVDAANTVGAHVVLISSDWVFDGTLGPADEYEPPNPINAYGFLKASSELVVTQRADCGTVARIAGVQGVHRARPRSPRAQDVGFGYLVASLQDALMAGEPFTVWDGPGVNQLATPVLATDAAELVWLALELELTGVLHCCGRRHTDRVSLARLAVEAFELEPELLRVGPVPSGATGSAPIPRDTRLDGRATAPRLGVELPDLEDMLGRLGQDLQNAREMRV